MFLIIFLEWNTKTIFKLSRKWVCLIIRQLKKLGEEWVFKSISNKLKDIRERMSMSDEEYYLSKSTDLVDCEHRQRQIMYGKFRRDGFLHSRY